MESLLHSLITAVSDHAGWAYVTVFLAALLEAIPVVGSFVPGTTIIVAISALVSSGGLDLWIILAAAILGGAIGDGGAFGAGYRIKRHVLQMWPLSAYPGIVAQSEEFFRRRGTLAVFLARFIAPVRAFVPLVAGAMGMAARRFFLVNLPAVALWAAAHVLASAFAADLLQRTALQSWAKTIEPYAIPVFAILAAIAFAVWAIRHWHLCAPHAIHLPHLHHARTGDIQPRETDLR